MVPALFIEKTILSPLKLLCSPKSACNYSRPSAYMVSQPRNLPLNNANLNCEGQLKISTYKWTCTVHPTLFKGQIYLWEELQGPLLLICKRSATLWPSSLYKLALQIFSGVIVSPVILEVSSTYL